MTLRVIDIATGQVAERRHGAEAVAFQAGLVRRRRAVRPAPEQRRRVRIDDPRGDRAKRVPRLKNALALMDSIDKWPSWINYHALL